MISREKQLEAVSNNLTNVNTTGFKADTRYFRTTLDNQLMPGGEKTATSDDKYFLGTDFSQGTLNRTHNPLDLAIVGKGFFVIGTDEGISYTRNGNFKLNENSELVTNQGHNVLGETGAIRITGHDVTLSEAGHVIVDGLPVDKLQVVDFDEPYQLRRDRFGNFTPVNPEEIGSLSQDFKVMQGSLERSNVNIIQEMIAMIELNRIYEALQKSVQTQDETLKLAANEIAR